MASCIFYTINSVKEHSGGPMSFTYKHARPAVTTDCVVFGLDDDDLKVLLIQRGQEPFKDRWALPGGFAEIGESLDNTALRELEEETGLQDVFLEQLFAFSDPNRDPREHVITIAYYALVNLADHKVNAATDARDATWFGIDDVPGLAFDHDNILRVAYERLRGKIIYRPICFELLPDKFTLRMLQKVYEIVLRRDLDKRNFRKKILSMGILEKLGEKETAVGHRPARLYRFNRDEYASRVNQGFRFELKT